MDKLQPLIKHRFWIIFAFSVIFAIVGWWMASGAILAATDARKKSVEESFSKAAQGKSEPNAEWVKAAQERNEKDEKSKLNASKMLWERQQAARRWPESLAKDFEKVSFQGEIKEVLTRRKWEKSYRTQIESLIEIVDPYDPKTKEGLVVVSINNIDHKPFSKWRYQLPVSTEIWTCQEDIWLMQSLLTSIARVNGEAKRITEAHVRRINRLSLRGGDPEATPAAAAGGGGGDGGGFGGDMAAMMGGSMRGDDLSGGGGLGTGAGAGVVSYPGKEFEGNAGNDILTEEFGAVAGATGAGLGGQGMLSSGGSSMDMMMMGGGGGGDGAVATEPTEEDRYVDDKEGQYKTRGFLLDVIVRDDQLPNLLASLTNSDFPVEIRRVEVVSGAVSSGASGAAGGMTSMGSSDGGMLSGNYGESDGSGMGLGGRGGKSMAMGMPGMDGGSGSGGMMSGMGMGMQGMGMQGMAGMGMSGMGAPGFGGGASASDPMAVAMADPLLVTVKIGGLMTLYQSKEESTAEDETEKAAATEQTTAAPPESTDPAAEGATGEMPAEGTSPDSEVPASTDTTSTETQTPADGAAPAEAAPSEGEMPADANPPAADSGSTPESTAPNGSESTPLEQPANTDEAPASTPADGETPAEPAGETPAGEAPSGEAPQKS